MINSKQIRKESIIEAVRLGYPVNPNLPLLDDCDEAKTQDQVIDRLLSLYTVVACSYGFPREKALVWLQRERLLEALAPTEKSYLELEGEPAKLSVPQLQVEALWALAWCLSRFEELDFSRPCDDNFINMLPDLVKNESANTFRGQCILREKSEILGQLDLAYCLHWGVKDSKLRGRPTLGLVQAHVVVERRRALEWIVGAQDWDELSLDT